MVALLVALSVMAVMLSVVLPIYKTVAQREREAELVFRGQQYARAVSLFQRKYANALPPNLDVLLNERFLRKKYVDPMTGEDFQLVGPGSPELANALNSAPAQQGQRGQQGPQGQQQGRPLQQLQQQTAQMQQTQSPFQSNPTTAGQAPGGILGVVSKSEKTSFRLYNGRDKYNQWVFIATQMSTAAGTGGRGVQNPGGPGPGGRGARGAGRGPGGPGPPTGGPFGQPFPGGNRPSGPGPNAPPSGGPGGFPPGGPGGRR